MKRTRFYEQIVDFEENASTIGWKIVTNSNTLERNGKAIEGGLYDPLIFEQPKMWQRSCKGFEASNRTWVPRKVEGKAAALELNAPIECKGHFNSKAPDGAKAPLFDALLVLPPEFRPLVYEPNGEVSKDTLAWLYIDVAKKNELVAQEYTEENKQLLEEAVNALYDRLWEINASLPQDSKLTMVFNASVWPLRFFDSYEELEEKLEDIASIVYSAQSKEEEAQAFNYLEDVYNQIVLRGDSTDEMDQIFYETEAYYR